LPHKSARTGDITNQAPTRSAAVAIFFASAANFPFFDTAASVDGTPIAARSLDRVERNIRTLNQLVLRHSVVRAKRGPHAGTYAESLTIRMDRTAQQLHDTSGYDFRRRLVLHSGLDERELIPAQTSERILRSSDRSQTLRTLPENLITGSVAISVIHLLESIQIDHVNCEPCSIE
jgi:hypothetical protein